MNITQIALNIKTFLFTNGNVLAQLSEEPEIERGFENHYPPPHYTQTFGSTFIIFLAVSFVLYIYGAVCLMIIARKTRTPHKWMAFIPLLNIMLAIKIAGRPWWWIFFLFVPFANIIFMIIIGAEICKRMGFTPWAVILFMLPLVNLIFLGFLASAQPEY